MSSNDNHLVDVDAEAKKVINDLNNMKSTYIQNKPQKPFRREIVWTNAVAFLIGHVFGFSALLWALIFDFPQFAAAYAVSYTIGLLGIMMGGHRYYSHRSFKASKPMQVILLIAHTICSQNCLWVWVRDHRQHHKYSDTDADPHNAKNGFFFSHVGWLLSKKHPEVIEKGKGMDMSDLDADPLVMFQKRHYMKLWVLFALVLPVLFPVYVMGQPWLQSFLLWDVGRIVLILNYTWLVNSWAHLYGTKPFDKTIMPTQSYLVSCLTSGEGWHNYHHAFPWDYKASEFGTPFSFVSSFIRFCARVGLVSDLKEASDDMILARACRTGDGTPIRTIPKRIKTRE